MAIKALVWDLDGTLIHFKIDYIRARRTAIKILREYGVPKKSLSINESILDSVRKSKEILEKQGYKLEEIRKIIKKVDEEVTIIEREAALKATIREGIDIVLEFAQNKNLKQAIYTYNTTENARISLETVNLLKYFDEIVGRDLIENPKPHPDHLLYICKKLEVKTPEIIIIGDTSRDIEGALNVKARSIALNSVFFKQSSKSEILHKADKIIEENEIHSKMIYAIEELIDLCHRKKYKY